MKFDYEFRTSENELRRGSISAADRDAAFAALKAQGIRPVKVVAAPGIWNLLFGRGKRWAAIVVLSAALVALFLQLRSDESEDSTSDRAALSFLDAKTRRQLIGDAAVIEKGIKDGWSDVFEHEGERFLAGFAVPGVGVSVRKTSEGEISAALSRRIVAEPADTLEARQIKAMVEGMKDELRTYLADGGTIVEYGRELVQRQNQEIAYHNRAKTELETAAKQHLPARELEQLWEARNSRLRAMGIRLIPLPE